jgi:hypothetical protein
MSSYKNISSIQQIRETSSEVRSLIFNEDNHQYLTWTEQNSHPSLKSSLYFCIKKDSHLDFERPIEIVKTEGMIVDYKILVNKNDIYIACISRNMQEEVLILLDSNSYGNTFRECRRIKPDGAVKELVFNLANGKPVIFCSISSKHDKTLNRIEHYTWGL